MEKLTAYTEPGLGSWKIPRDGTYRYLYDTWQPLTLFVLTVCFTAAFYSVYTPVATIAPNDLFYCNSDGNLIKALGYYKPLWDPEMYFTVNIAFGKFAFSTAKVIDAVWDAVVARGGQVLAAMVAYRTLRRSLTLTMEASTVTMSTVATLYCNQIQMISLRRLLQDIFSHKGSPNPQRRRSIYLGKCVYSCRPSRAFTYFPSPLCFLSPRVIVRNCRDTMATTRTNQVSCSPSASSRCQVWSYTMAAGSGAQTHLSMRSNRSLCLWKV